MSYLAGILCSSDLTSEEQKIAKDKEGCLCSVIPFLMTKNNAACNKSVAGSAPSSLRPKWPWGYRFTDCEKTRSISRVTATSATPTVIGNG